MPTGKRAEGSSPIEPATIEVRTFKYDGSEHRRWTGRVVERDGSLIVLTASFAFEIQHDELGTIPSGTFSVEYYWLDRWFNVFRFAKPNGTLRNFYCNISIPPCLMEPVLSYVDLDIDVLVQPDFSYRVLDVAEFKRNAARYEYPASVQENAYRGLTDLINLIEARGFPFDV